MGGAEVVELRCEVWRGCRCRLDGDGVGPEVYSLDEALGGREVGVVVELEESAVSSC